MSIQAVAWVLENSQSRGFARLVLLSLANHHNGGSGQCNPGQRRIASEAGISAGSVTANIQKLVTLGEVRILDPGSSHRPAQYELCFAREMSVLTLRPTESTRGSEPSTRGNGQSTRGLGRAEPINQEPIPLASVPRPRDEIFDTLCDVTDTDPGQLTTSGRGVLNKATKELRALEATPTDIRRRHGELARRYPNARATAPALVKHWASLGPVRARSNGCKATTIDEDLAEYRRLTEGNPL